MDVEIKRQVVITFDEDERDMLNQLASDELERAVNAQGDMRRFLIRLQSATVQS